jgi:hypothetical protein
MIPISCQNRSLTEIMVGAAKESPQSRRLRLAAKGQEYALTVAPDATGSTRPKAVLVHT